MGFPRQEYWSGLLLGRSVLSDSWQHYGLLQAGFPALHHLQNLLKLLSIESVMTSNHPILFSTCLPSFPASGSFPVSRLFSSGSQSIGASDSALVLPGNIQGWLPLGFVMEKWESRVAKHTSEDTQDSGQQFITPACPRGIGSKQGPRHFQETRFYTLHWMSVYMFATFFMYMT